ncbi:MAG: methyltransferase domain-containing protein [Opitutales bacterium]|jgi:ubiquinone/menaquinone biosynthesis C-methylase UbiE|nr:methyltransferase domain-containing protein [Opitutales bacterium]MBT5169689.1 methyltransferase domain-containing protein [Opitutales bacterium]MBT5813959.1 methyltransferase domain-containing protein [Opitutales bacterium]MBT6769637.1 methyltransferase domain-containing protein [Opitutales bacterium]MDG2255683.1 methyltransferase domain-containing protein [Opitutaceae bacterium]
MNIRSIALILFSSLISSPFLLAQDKSDSRYTIGERTRDGIGKYYLGREIAQVMGHQGISWLERDTREAEEAPSKAIELLELKPDTIIADIGAGSGFYSFRLAKLLPQGKVIAVDIQQEMLDFLAKRAKETNTANVQPHMGSIESIQLPENSIDATLFVDAYHEFSHPFEMMTSILKALRPGGIVYLLEYRAEDQNVPIKPLHKMSQTQARKEMALVGFEWVGTKNELPWQHLMIFKKPE